MSNEDHVILVALWLAGIAVSMVVIYFFFRWLFAIDKRVKQNEEIIELLKGLKK